MTSKTQSVVEQNVIGHGVLRSAQPQSAFETFQKAISTAC